MTATALKEASFEDLVVQALPAVKRFAISLTKDSVRGEDLVQETMLKALAHKDKFESGTNIQAWLFTICRNTFYSQHRKKTEAEDPEGFLEGNLADEEAVGEEGLTDEADLTRKLIHAFPKPLQDVLQDLSEGLTYGEMAEKRGVEEGTVKSRINRARNELGLVAGRTSRHGKRAITKSRQEQHLVGIGGVDGVVLRKIDISAFQPPQFETELGAEPKLMWLPIAQLFIDETYQRMLRERGIGNVYRITRQFDWKKFAAVVVAKIPGDLDARYAIVDGQHRTYAAALRGLTKVPCLLVDANQQEQAASFAAINSKVTQVSKLHVFAANVAAGEPEAVAITKACADAQVTICRYPQHEPQLKPRETVAVGAITRVYREKGADVLTLALKCILQRHYHERGVLREPLIKGMADVIVGIKQRPAAFLAAADSVNFQRVLIEAKILAAQKFTAVRTAVFELLLPKFS